MEVFIRLMLALYLDAIRIAMTSMWKVARLPRVIFRIVQGRLAREMLLVAFFSPRQTAGRQIREHEETTHLSPTSILRTSTYESRRLLGAEQPVLPDTSSGFRTYSSGVSPRSSRFLPNEPLEEEETEVKYEVTLSSYDESGLKILATNPLSPSIDSNDEWVRYQTPSHQFSSMVFLDSN